MSPRLSIPLVLLGVATSLSTAVLADDGLIEEVVVTGQVLYRDQVNALKTPTPILDVPQSVVVISTEQIESRGYASITDIVNYVPGLNSSQGEGHRDSVVFRGVRSTADFFVDGVRDDVQYYRPLYNVEQVEVLKGPNALLFGRGGTGGVLNRVMKKGALGESFIQVSASVDTFGGAALQVDRNVDVSENTALRVNAAYESLENHRNFFDGDRLGVNPLSTQLSQATTIDLSYEYLDHERFIDAASQPVRMGVRWKPLKTRCLAIRNSILMSWRPTCSRRQCSIVFLKTSRAIECFLRHYDKLYQNFYVSATIKLLLRTK